MAVEKRNQGSAEKEDKDVESANPRWKTNIYRET
jgi:hypothetical protein